MTETAQEEGWLSNEGSWNEVLIVNGAGAAGTGW